MNYRNEQISVQFISLATFNSFFRTNTYLYCDSLLSWIAFIHIFYTLFIVTGFLFSMTASSCVLRSLHFQHPYLLDVRGRKHFHAQMRKPTVRLLCCFQILQTTKCENRGCQTERCWVFLLLFFFMKLCDNCVYCIRSKSVEPGSVS